MALLAFIPVFPTFFISFLPVIAKLTLSTAALVLFISVVNSPIEEFYWRGLYLLEFRDNKWIGFFLSALLFGAWHFAVWFAKGVHYNGGMLPLIGGAYGLGAPGPGLRVPPGMSAPRRSHTACSTSLPWQASLWIMGSNLQSRPFFPPKLHQQDVLQSLTALACH